MRNPLRSEAEAYRFVWLTIGYLGAIVIASVAGGRWAGLAVFVLLTAVLFAVWVRARREEGPLTTAPSRRGGEDERLILVIANETVGGRPLLEEIRRRSEGVNEQVLVVCPALNSPLRHWVSDTDSATAAAEVRLASSLRRLEAEGIRARGEVGDADPLQAIEDALRTFGADEVIISTHPEGRSHWLERGVVTGARERFVVPITHVVVDLEAES
jgi:hypothetical protein